MSMKTRMMAVLAVLAVVSTGCGRGNGVKGSVQRPAQDFTKLKLQSGVEAKITVGPFQPLVLEGDENLLGEDIFQTQVEGDTLIAAVGFSMPSMPFTLNVQMPTLDGIT